MRAPTNSPARCVRLLCQWSKDSAPELTSSWPGSGYLRWERQSQSIGYRCDPLGVMYVVCENKGLLRVFTELYINKQKSRLNLLSTRLFLSVFEEYEVPLMTFWHRTYVLVPGRTNLTSFMLNKMLTTSVEPCSSPQHCCIGIRVAYMPWYNKQPILRAPTIRHPIVLAIIPDLTPSRVLDQMRPEISQGCAGGLSAD